MKRILSVLVLTLVASFAIGQIPPMPLPLPLPMPQIPQPLPQPIKPLTPTLPSLPPAPTPAPSIPAKPAQPAQPAPEPARSGSFWPATARFLQVSERERTVDLTGRWRVTWVADQDIIFLTDSPTGITGALSRTDDDCFVTGGSNGTQNDGKVHLDIACNDSELHLDGLVELEGDEIQGHYTEKFRILNTEGTITGKFKMLKTHCMLPEGCKNN